MTNIKKQLNNLPEKKILDYATSVSKELGIPSYLVGGYVRDLILNRKTTDIDIMVEGDAILYAKMLGNELGVQKIVEFKEFGTARIPYEKFEIEVILNDDDDSRNAIITIHPGAGGKESQDWAYILFRMYKRWIDKEDFSMNILNYQDAEDDGIKDVIHEKNVYIISLSKL